MAWIPINNCYARIYTKQKVLYTLGIWCVRFAYNCMHICFK